MAGLGMVVSGVLCSAEFGGGVTARAVQRYRLGRRGQAAPFAHQAVQVSELTLTPVLEQAAAVGASEGGGGGHGSDRDEELGHLRGRRAPSSGH